MSTHLGASTGSVLPGAGEPVDRGRGVSPGLDGVKAQPGATALSLASHALAAAGELEVLARVRSDRLRLRARRMLSRAPGKALGGIILGVGAVCATWLAAGGLAEVLEGLFGGPPGLGRFSAGALLLLAGGGWLRLRSLLAERSALKRLRSRYAEHAQDVSTDPT